LLACTTAQSVHAEGRFFYFGDSLSDNGRLGREAPAGGNPALGYVGGRSSNGPTWGELLPDIVGLDYNQDYGYAYGGATTRNDGLADAIIPVPNPTGYLHQITQIENSGITLTKDDVVGIWIGHNDIHPVAAFGGNPDATAATAITNVTEGIDRLIALGAKRIVLLNVYDIGQMDPAILSYPSFDASVATRISTLINEGLDQIARDGVIIHQLDTFELLARVQADPSTYGFSRPFATDSCVVNGCGTLTLEEQNEFVFMDGIHFTTAFSDLVANYASKLILAASVTRANARSGFTTVDSFQQGVLTQFGLNGSNWVRKGRFSSYIEANGVSSDSRAFGIFQTQTDTTLGGLTFGGKFEYSDTVSFGLVGNLSRGETDLGDDLGDNDFTAGQIAGLVSINRGALYSNIGVSLSFGSIDLNRSGVITDLDADTDMKAFGAFAEVGYLFDVGSQGWQIGPVASARFTDLDVDDYTESGDSLLALSVDEQNQTQTFASVGLGFQNTSLSNEKVSVSGLIALEYSGEDFDDLTYYQVNNPSRAIVEEGGSSDDFYARVALNVGYQINEGTTAYFGVNGTAGREFGNELGLRGGIGILF